MKIFRFIFVFLVMIVVAGVQPAEAQFGGLGKKLKKKVEREVKKEVKQEAKERVVNRADRAMSSAISKTVESVADEIEGSVEGMILSNEPPNIEVGDNETGDPDAPFISYTSVSRINLQGGGTAEKLLNRYGATRETVSTYDAFQRIDRDKSSQVTKAKTGDVIQIDHESKEWWVTSVEDLVSAVEKVTEEGMPGGRPQMTDETRQTVGDMKVTVYPRDENKIINGSEASRTVAVVEGEYEMTGTDPETNETVSMKGRSYTVFDQWHSTEVAGYKTIHGFQRQMADRFVSAMGGSSFGDMIGAMGSAPEFQQSAAEGFRKLGEIEGLMVYQAVSFFQVPEGADFDLEAALSDDVSEGPASESGAQRKVMTVISEIGDLKAGTPDMALFDAPSSDEYTQIESPLKRAMQEYGDGQ